MLNRASLVETKVELKYSELRSDACLDLVCVSLVSLDISNALDSWSRCHVMLY